MASSESPLPFVPLFITPEGGDILSQARFQYGLPVVAVMKQLLVVPL